MDGNLMEKHLMSLAEWQALTPASQENVKQIQGRLTLATDLIKVLSHNGLVPPNMMVDKGEAWKRMD